MVKRSKKDIVENALNSDQDLYESVKRRLSKAHPNSVITFVFMRQLDKDGLPRSARATSNSLINIRVGHAGNNNDAGVALYAGELCKIIGGVFHDNLNNGISLEAASNRNQIVGATCNSNTGGVGEQGLVISNGLMNSVTGGYFEGNAGDGIELDNSYLTAISGVNCRSNGGNGILVQAATGNGGYNAVSGSICSSNTGYGVMTAHAGAFTEYYDAIVGNAIYDNTAGEIALDTLTICRHNAGFVTENSGSDTIANGTTTKEVTHGCSYTPSLADITITLGEDPTNSPGAVFVDTLGPVTFAVKCENDPGASNLDFGWSVRRH